MLLIYTPNITSRIQYIFSLVFTELLKLDFEFTADKDHFSQFDGAKMSYSSEAIGDELHFFASQLLYEKGISEQTLKVIESNGTKALIFNNKPFDPFAAAFYLVSRYEEYLPHQKDEHGRFEASQSLAYRHQFLTKPLVNIWAEQIKASLFKKSPHLNFGNRSYQYINTIDIDNAYAYKGKGFLRITGALMKSLLKFDFNSFSNRYNVIFRNHHDPFDTYNLIKDLNNKHALASIYFFLVGDFREHDRNLSIKQKKYRQLIRTIADYSDVGIHPSYASNQNTKIVAREIKILNQILKKEVAKSRQHFLKMSLPDTYRNLIENDILEDYSMGYAEHIGFRASICSPYFFYDLLDEQAKNLRIFPFAVMDATLRNYMKLNPIEALDKVLPIINETKVLHGTFISLWHNESLSEIGEWKNWRMVYEQVLKYACP